MIDLTPQQISFVTSIIHRYLPDCKISIFGTRATGKAKPYSDLDIILQTKESIPTLNMFNIKEDLSESDLPFRVDVLDWQAISEEFKAAIEPQLKPIIIQL
jgi:predicted nucleotidyltransferase